MIYNLIGSGILVLAGVAIGVAAMGAYWCYHHVRAMAEANATIARQTDLIGQLQDKRDRALACETPNAAHGLKKACKILRGEV